MHKKAFEGTVYDVWRECTEVLMGLRETALEPSTARGFVCFSSRVLSTNDSTS